MQWTLFTTLTFLEEGLLPAVNDIFGDVWKLQQDNALIYTAAHTKNWLDANDINVLEWLSTSPDINIIENVRGLFARLVYKDGATYKTVEQLTHATLCVGITLIYFLLKSLQIYSKMLRFYCGKSRRLHCLLIA